MTAYPQRTDLNASPAPATQPVRAASGQTYGVRGQQEAAQRAIPLPDLSAPTARPNEPIHAGMPTGPGPGPMEAGIPSAPAGRSVGPQQVRDFFHALYAQYPTADLADLLATLGQDG